MVEEEEDLNKDITVAELPCFSPLSSPSSQRSHGQPSDLHAPSSFLGSLS